MTTTAPTPPGGGVIAASDQVLFDNLGTIASSTQTNFADNWTVRVRPGPEAGAAGGAMRRTKNPQRAVDDRLVIEVDYAAAVAARGNNAWGEVVVTTAIAPIQPRRDALYAAEWFPGHYSFGCRLQADRTPFCHLYDNGPATTYGRIWQMSPWEPVGVQQPVTNADRDAWRVCAAGQPPTACMDRFQIEITRTSVSFVVNGRRQLTQTGLEPLPAELFTSDVQVYVASMVSRHPQPEATFDWGRLAVNP